MTRDPRITCINKVWGWGGGWGVWFTVYTCSPLGYINRSIKSIIRKTKEERKKERVCQENTDYKQTDNHTEFLKY